MRIFEYHIIWMSIELLCKHVCLCTQRNEYMIISRDCISPLKIWLKISLNVYFGLCEFLVPPLVVDTHLRKLLWVYCPGHAGVKENDGSDRLAGKATLTSGLLLGRSEVLRSLRHYLRAQSQGHHTIYRLQEEGVERER